MKVEITYFKPSGKYYTLEKIEIPDNAPPWEYEAYLPVDRLLDMYAVAMDTPWGYPSMCPPENRRR